MKINITLLKLPFSLDRLMVVVVVDIIIHVYSPTRLQHAYSRERDDCREMNTQK